MGELYQVFCPVCSLTHGPRAERHPTKKYIKLGEHNFWAEVLNKPFDQFGVIQTSEGRGTFAKAGYFSPEEDPTGSYPLVKARLLKAVRAWIDNGWLDPAEVEAMLAGEIEIPDTGTVSPGPSGARQSTTRRPAPRPETAVELRRRLSELMNEEDKSRSLRLLKKALPSIDEDRFDISGIEEAIEEYQGITRAGISLDEYQEAKSLNFDFIIDTINELENGL